MKPTSILHIALAALTLAATSVRAELTDLAVVEANVRESTLSAVISPDSIASLRSTMLADGSWPDIDYGSTSRTNWPPETHLTRLLDLARAHAKPGSPLEGDPGVLADALKALDAWIARDPTSDNWWFNEIKAPQVLGQSLLLLEHQLSAAQLADGVAIVARAYQPRSNNGGTNTGANRTDRAYAGILRGLILDDEAILADAYLAIGDTIIVTTAEGIQPDYSYHQHGAQLYIQGYGLVYFRTVLRYGTWSAGTSFAFTPSQRELLVDCLLEGVQWFIRGNNLDPGATGRILTRNSQASNASGFRWPIADALAIGAGYRQAELQNFSDRLNDAVDNGAADPALAWIGHRHFPRSDSTTFHRPEFAVFLKTSSTRTLQPESGNGEGLKSLHLADGVTLLHRSGNEYDDIMPLWDWRKLPGTTTEQAGYSLQPSGSWGMQGTSTHAGGVSDGSDGATAFAYDRLGVSARKSWFFLGDRMIALGTGINAPAATQSVITTVNQCLLDGAVTYSTAPGSSSALATSREDHSALRWVHHGGMGYYFPGGSGAATLVEESRTGTWYSINTTQSTDEVTGDVFALELDHGPAVAGGTYAYIVTPVDDAAAMEASSPDDVIIERNDTVAQAVSETTTGSSAVNFWAPGSAAGISADQPCSVLLKRGTDSVVVSISDPTQALTAAVNLAIDLPASGVLSADSAITVLEDAGLIRLRVDLSQSDGHSLQATFSLRPNAYERISLPCVADGYVWDQNPDTSYGTSTSAAVKMTTGAGYNRASYFRFDLSSLPVPPVAAYLKLHTLAASGIPAIHGVHATDGSAWSESTLTWNSRPATVGPALDTWLSAPASGISADVSSAATGATLDLAVYAQAVGVSDYVTYATREHATPEWQPVLEVLVPRPEIEIWRLDWFGADAGNDQIAGDAADPDRDDLPNAIEFVLGTPPNAASAAQRPQLAVGNTELAYSFRRSHASSDEEVVVEASPDLVTWTPLVHGINGVAFSSNPIPGESDVDQIEVTWPRPGSANERYFIRLSVNRQPSTTP